MHNERMCLAALRGAIQEANEVQRKNRARERGEVALFIMQRLPMTLKQIFNSAESGHSHVQSCCTCSVVLDRASSGIHGHSSEMTSAI